SVPPPFVPCNAAQVSENGFRDVILGDGDAAAAAGGDDARRAVAERVQREGGRGAILRPQAEAMRQQDVWSRAYVACAAAAALTQRELRPALQAPLSPPCARRAWCSACLAALLKAGGARTDRLAPPPSSR